MSVLLWLLALSICIAFTHARIHQLTINDDERTFIRLASFGFYEHGYLLINFTDFRFKIQSGSDPSFGFVLHKTQNRKWNPEMMYFLEKCVSYEDSDIIRKNINVTFFNMDFQKNLLHINCRAQSEMAELEFFVDMPKSSSSVAHSINPQDEDSAESMNIQSALDVNQKTSCARNLTFPLMGNATTGYSTKLVMYVASKKGEGLFEIFFRRCPKESIVESSFVADIEEFNFDEFSEERNYLSAGEMLLPKLYYEMFISFLPWAVFWIFTLAKTRHPVYKIHYLMAALIILKLLQLLFHGVNYHYIGTKGKHVATWAILYYIINLLRGALLFITLILIGTGWTLIKHFLSPKDKKIFMIVIPLQVFANIAEIIMEESEEGNAEQQMWFNVFVVVDIICCVAVLFPISWSMKHLQDASHTDGKAAINLRKLKLFRQFYFLTLGYMYFSRMLLYLVKVTLPFQYEWLGNLFREFVTLVYFILTGYKFRPAPDNPYLHVPNAEDNDEMDVVISKCGLTEGLTKLSRISNDFGDDDKDSLLIYKRESSYDYD